MSRFDTQRSALGNYRPDRRSFLRATGGLALAGFAGGALVGCGPTGSGAAGDGNKTLNLGFSVTFLTSPFWAVTVEYVKKEIAAHGVKMLETVNANQDSAKQNADFQSLIASGANGLLCGVPDPAAIAPGLAYAKSKKVPVVTIDDAPSTGECFAIVRADNEKMGALTADVLGPAINGRGKVLCLTGLLTTTNGRDRTKGFVDAMKAKYPNAEIIIRDAGWDGSKAGDIAATILTQNPDLAGIHLQSDTIYQPAVFSALKSQGKLHPAGHPDHLPIAGIDGGPQALDAVRAGTMDAVVCQPNDLFAKWGVQYLIDALAGKTLALGPTDHDSKIVTLKGNKEDLLPSPLVTKKNVDDASLWGNQPQARA